MSLSFATRPALTEVTGAVATLGTPQTFDLRATDGDDELVITSVELVFDEIELERAGLGDGCGDDDDSYDDSSSGSSGDDDCMEIETGPELVVLPLGDGAPLPAIAVHVPAGTYSQLEMKLRPLNPGSSEDRRFLAANPGFDGINLRVRGTFDGSAFEYTASLDNEIELYFRPALEVGEGGVNITINLDVLSWFRGTDGALIDPRTASPGQPNASVVAANIWRSLAVYEDDDHDGYDDHGGHGGRDGDD
ncbi:MAG TPA: hypothetical protein VFZ11_08920 [Gemmatimonadaceae bacterium]